MGTESGAEDLMRKIHFGVYLAIMLFASVLAETLIVRKEYFASDSLGFFAWYGFLSSLGLIGVTKLFASLIKRDDSYYLNRERDADND